MKVNKKILMIEKGKKIENRQCPIKKKNKCLKCKPTCDIICGFSGAGAFSDGKLLMYQYSPYNRHKRNLYIGGKSDSYIKKYYTKREIVETMNYVDNIYIEFGAPKELKGLNVDIDDLSRKAKENNLNLIDVPIRHLGTEMSREIYKKFQDILDSNATMLYDTEVQDLIIKNNKISGVITTKGEFYSNNVVLGVGVGGASWLEELSKKYNIKNRNGYIDIGIRYELSNSIMDNINKLLYEGKFIGKIKPYNDKIRTYCQNPGGFVTPETYDNGCSLVNGHSYKNKKSDNTNLAILVSYKFDPPFNSPNEYGFNIARKANMLSNGSAIIQKYGDLKNGKITTKDKLIKNKIKPTYQEAFPYDLSYVLDYRTLTNIKNFIETIGKFVPGFNNEENLLYGPEIKFYGNELELDDNFMTSVNGLYSIGTGGGLTIGLMMASVSGVLFARKFIRR